MYRRERKPAARTKPSRVERRVFGQDPDGVDEVEAFVRKLERQRIAFDELDAACADAIGADRTRSFREHGRGRIETDEAVDVRQRRKIAAGAATEIEDVNRRIEPPANVLQPGTERTI